MMSEIRDMSDLMVAELTEPFIYIANPGNAGDALMACATYDLFDRLMLRYTSVGHEFLVDLKNIENRIIVLAGGGNFNESGYNTYAELLSRMKGYAKKIIVLPHTINGNEDLLSELGGNIILICRERVSFDHVRKFASGAHVHLAHDMAFMLDVAGALKYKPNYLMSALKKIATRLIDKQGSRSYLPLEDYKNGFLQTVVWSNINIDKRKNAFLFRTDIEKTGRQIPDGNIDAALTCNFGATTSLRARYTVYHLLQFLNMMTVIHTDRLHVCIAAALLNKEVHLHANNYYKCRAVYEYSIKNRFPLVVWHD